MSEIVVGISHGGTGATNAADALKKLGLPDPAIPSNSGKIVSSDGSKYVLGGDIVTTVEVDPTGGLENTGQGSNVVLGIKSTSVTPNTYNFPNSIEVNDKGQIESIKGLDTGVTPISVLTSGDNFIDVTDGTTANPIISIRNKLSPTNGGTGSDLSNLPEGTVIYASSSGAFLPVAAPSGPGNWALSLDNASGIPMWKDMH